jgi:hypothetical protein
MRCDPGIGPSVHGRLVSLSSPELEIAESVDGAPERLNVLADADITRVARVAGKSKPARACIGAAAGALLSLPLSISMVGDMMMPAAILGSLLGRGAGDSRLEVVLQR